jgi:hypothetical protein
MNCTFIKKGILFTLLLCSGFQISRAENLIFTSDRFVAQATASPTVTSPVNYCQDETASPLEATGTDLSWYTTATGGTKLAEAPTPATTAAGTTSYYVTQTIDDEESERVEIKVIVSETPGEPNVSAIYEFCKNQGMINLQEPYITEPGLKWYTSETGGSPLVVIRAPIVNLAYVGTTTYYVSKTVGNCEGPRKKVDMVVNPPSPPPTLTSPSHYCASTTPVPALTVSGNNVRWYYSDGLTLTREGPPIPNLNVTESQVSLYRVSQSDPGGCESQRMGVAIQVTKAKTPVVASGTVELCLNESASPLNAAVSDGGALKWYNSIAGSTSVSNIPSTNIVGNQTYYVSQTIKDCESDRARIDVKVKAATPAPTLSSTTYTFSKGATPTSLTATGTGIKWYSVATGGTGSATAPTISTAAIGTTSYYVSQTIANCESPRVKVDVVVTDLSVPPTVTSPTTYCASTTPVAALVATGTAVKWYATAAATTPLASAPVPNVNVSTTTTYKYYVTQTEAGKGESAKKEVVITVTKLALPTVSSAAIQFCLNEVATGLTATGVAGATFKWYAAVTGGESISNVPVTTTAGNKIYYVSQVKDGCESDRAAVTVTVKALPAPPVLTTPVYTFCKGAVPTALSAVGTSVRWYTTPTGGTPLTSVPVANTSTVGTTSYYLTQTVNNCESPREKMDVVITDLSAQPVITSPTTYCASTTPATALVATGTAVKWYATAAATTPLTSAPIPNVNVSTTTTYKYYVTQTEVGKCESAKKEVVVTVTKLALPKVSRDIVEYCLNEVATGLEATGVAGATFKWYASTTGTDTISNIPVTTTAGNKLYYVSQTKDGCESDRAAVTVTVKPATPAPTLTALRPVCVGEPVTSATINNAATTTGTGTKLWYTALTGGNGVAMPTVPNTSKADTIVYYVSQVVNKCESTPRAKVTLVVKALPVAPTVAAVEYCKDVTDAVALTAVGTGTNAIKWYTVATAGTALAAAPKPATTNAGTMSYYASQAVSYPVAGSTALVCEGPRAKLDVTIMALPASATATNLAPVCQETADKTYTFQATGAAGNTFNWYKMQTGGIKEPAVPTLNLNTAGETTYYVTQVTAKGCESATRVAAKMRVKKLPAVPTVTPAIEYCQLETAKSLTATGETGALINWYGSNVTGGTASAVAPIPSTKEGGTTSFYVSQTLEACEGSRAKIDVLIKTTPKPTTETYLAFCQDEQGPVLSAVGENLLWYREETQLTGGQTTPFIVFTNKVEDYAYFVTQTGANKCESPKEKIVVHIKPRPSVTISGNSSIPINTAAKIKLSFLGDGPWTYLLSDGTTGTTEQSTIEVEVRPAQTTTYSVLKVSNACGEGIQVGSAVVTVLVPTISTGIPHVTDICAGKEIQVPYQQSGTFPADHQFILQLSKSQEDTTFVSIASTATANLVRATIPENYAGAYFVRIVSVGADPIYMVKGSIASISLQVKSLPTGTISGTQTILVGDPATLKVELKGEAPWTFNLYNGVKDSLITAEQTPFSFAVRPAATTTYSINTIGNVCGVALQGTGSAVVKVDPILGVEKINHNFAKVYPTLADIGFRVELVEGVSPTGATMELLDLSGRTVLQKAIHEKITEVDLLHFPTGLYLVKVRNGIHSGVYRVIKN